SVILKKAMPSIVLACIILLVLLIGSFFLVHYITNMQYFSNRQQEFISTVTHELKTPLAIISAAGQNMVAGIINKPDKITHYGKMIEKESQRLRETIDYYLLYSRMTSAENIKKKECDIVELVKKTFQTTISAHLQSGLHHEMSLPNEKILLFCDDVAITTVIQNLVINALKHASEGKYIKLQLTSENVIIRKGLFYKNKIHTKAVFIRIIDRGEGIPKYEQKFIFEPFGRGAKANLQQIEGSGIGLNLVQRIIKLHNGEIIIEKSNSEGTTFLVVLPLI
ncbi:MAG: sensor histidine kinase, partial [Treponemataceae bacterium]